MLNIMCRKRERRIKLHNKFKTFKRLFPALALISILALTFMPVEVFATETYQRFGPRIDYLRISVFTAGRTVEFNAFKTGAIDIIDWPLDKDTYDLISTDPDYIVEPLKMADMYNLEMNCMKWPTSDVNFRRAIAYIIDKTTFYQTVLKSFSGVLMDTPIPEGCGLDQWYNPNTVKYTYDRAEARRILDAAGFTVIPSGPNAGKRQDPHKPAGETLDELLFYIRLDDPDRDAIGTMIALELEALGIPLKDHGLHRVKTVCWTEVMMYPYNYHLYTGGWGPWRDPDYMYDMYNSLFGKGWYPKSWANNYVFFDNSTFDDWSRQLKFAPTMAAAVEPAMKCQEILMDQVPMVPLWHSAGASALRSTYGHFAGEEKYWDRNWLGSVNSLYISGMSNPTLNCRWTFMNAHASGFERGTQSVDNIPMTLRYGFMDDADVLNPVHADFYWDWEVLDKIYDYLTLSNPFTGEEIAWMTTSVPVPETWTYQGNPATKLTYHLRNNILWHDGVQFTSADVKFTLEYMKAAFAPLFYFGVLDIDHIDTPDPYTAEVYYKVQSTWALHWVGGLPMIPQHVWGLIPAGESREHGEYETTGMLTGTGPFRFVSREKDQWLLLEDNPTYFRKLVQPDFAKVVGGVTTPSPDGRVDIWDFLTAAGHFGCTYPWLTGPHATWDPIADVNKDLTIDLDDIMEIGVRFGDIGYIDGYPPYYMV